MRDVEVTEHSIASAESRNEGRMRVAGIGKQDDGNVMLDVVREGTNAKVVASLRLGQAVGANVGFRRLLRFAAGFFRLLGRSSAPLPS